MGQNVNENKAMTKVVIAMKKLMYTKWDERAQFGLDHRDIYY